MANIMKHSLTTKCAKCTNPYGQHRQKDDACPAPIDTKFTHLSHGYTQGQSFSPAI